jgi:transposase
MLQEPTSPPSQRRAIYPSDVRDEEWAFCAPYLCLIREYAPQCDHSLRELFNGLRYIVRAGCRWRMLPHAAA